MTFTKSVPRMKVYEGANPGKPRTISLARTDGSARMAVPIPKDEPVRDEAYRRLVAGWDCAHCGKGGPSQFAHGDEGKGMAIKACDLTGYPLCADGPGRQGCHSVIGASGMFTRDQRRRLESGYAAQTRERAASMGKLPGKGK